jgi:exodeoxyribonuclease X
VSRPWRGTRWFIDVEGNGARVSQIVELGAVETIDLEPTGRTRRWMVKPSEPIDPYATKVHGITNDDVAHLPSLSEHLPEIMETLQGVAVGGHAVHGDLDIITRDVKGWRPSSATDSLIIVRTLVHKEGGHRLSAMIEHLGLHDEIDRLVGGRAHTAVYDAMGSALVLRTLRDSTGEDEYDRTFRQAESMERWDGMVRNRIRKADKAARNIVDHEIRRRMNKERER